MRRLARHWLFQALIISVITCSVFLVSSQHVSAACTDAGFGVVSGLSVTIGSADAGNYAVWSRMQVPNSSNTYLLEVDGTCYTIGGTNLATNQWIWTNKQSNNATLSINLATGTHNVRVLGTAENVLLDRIIFTKDTSSACNPPTGLGDSCVNAVTLFPGDTNGDGNVTITDLNAVINNWGGTGKIRATGDLSGDGTVSITDLNQVLNNWTR